MSRQGGMSTVGKHVLCVAVVMVVFFSCATASFAATPPPQPTSGPGGADYPYAGYAVVHAGSGNYEYWMYEPREPQPASAPVVVFNHAWGGMTPDPYLAWLEHLVKKGNIVIFPRYQESLSTPPTTFTDNAITAVLSALHYLEAHPEDTQAELDRFAILGHSYGGYITMNMANRWQSAGLPQPKVLMPTEPGGELTVLDDPLTGVPSTVLLNCHVGADDHSVANRVGCDTIWNRISHIPVANKDYVCMYSDTYGYPALIADHWAPVTNSGGTVDALDYYGYWKTFDALCDCAFYGTNCAYGLGNTPEHRYMGLWSDGQPVVELQIADFIPDACGNPVGGIAQAPDTAAPAGDESLPLGVPAAAVAVGVVALVTGGWLVRRRLRGGTH